jgi:hypothetical protein
MFHYNFKEEHGNFQYKNMHNKGGKEKDAIQVVLQDPLNSQNAIFWTYDDGIPGEMHLGLFHSHGTNQDSAFDNTVIVRALSKDQF